MNPYPFSVPAAQALLAAHGWKVVPDGVTTCSRPGAAADECGAGIKPASRCSFTLMYPSGLPYTDGAMADLQSVAKQVGIEITLNQVTSATIAATIEPCAAPSPACSWQIGQYGGAWLFEPDHYPSGEEIFQTGALGNVNNYSDPAIDKLITATTTTAGERRPGGARRLRRPGPAAAARLLAAEPGHADHGRSRTCTASCRTPTASSTRRSGTSRSEPAGSLRRRRTCVFRPAAVSRLVAGRAGLHLRLTNGAG